MNDNLIRRNSIIAHFEITNLVELILSHKHFQINKYYSRINEFAMGHEDGTFICKYSYGLGRKRHSKVIYTQGYF